MRTALCCRPLFAAVALSSLLFVPVVQAEERKPAVRPAAQPTLATRVLELLAPAQPAKTPAQKEAEAKGTHQEAEPIKVIGTDGKTQMQTMCVDQEGRVLALVAPPRGYGAPVANASGEVHVFSAEGKPLKNWKVKFHTHSINTGPEGTIYVAGDGKVAKFDKEGKLLAQIELPHIADLLKDKATLKKEAEEQLKQQQQSYTKLVEMYKKRIEDLKAIPEGKRTALQKNQLKQFESLVTTYERLSTSNTTSVDSIIQTKVGRLRIINGIAVSSKDVFVACGEAKGWGYAVWRMDHDFKNAKPVITGLGGCCGQMDIQCLGEDVLVAENTKHQFARYDREGKRKGGWGKRGTEELSCFGGCCNPMNLRASKTNEIYTAESEGLIKRFDDKGEFLGVVGYAPLTGGCKNVAVGVSPDGTRVYFADQPGSRIIVLTKKTNGKTE